MTAHGSAVLQMPRSEADQGDDGDDRAHDVTREELRHLDIELIDRCPHQPRQWMDPAAMEELIASVSELGILQPIRVRPREGGRYQIVTGERRWTAARRVGLTEIPCVIADVDDDRAAIEALVENVQREDLNLLDRAQALASLRRRLGLSSWEAVGQRIGISKSHVNRLLKVTKLAEPLREDVRYGELGEKYVRALYMLRAHPRLQVQLWEGIHQRKGPSGDEAIRLARDLLRTAAEGRDTPASEAIRSPHATAKSGLEPSPTAVRRPVAVDRSGAALTAMDALMAAVTALDAAGLRAVRRRLEELCDHMLGILES